MPRTRNPSTPVHSPLKPAGPVMTTYKSPCGSNAKARDFQVFQGKTPSSYNVRDTLTEMGVVERTWAEMQTEVDRQ